MAVDQKHERISFSFLISLSFKENCSPCFRPKVDPVMEEVLEAFAVSVKCFSPYLCVKFRESMVFHGLFRLLVRPSHLFFAQRAFLVLAAPRLLRVGRGRF